MHRLSIVFVLALASSGCLRSTTAIVLRADGSGTVVQETGVGQQAIAMIKGLGVGQTGERPELFGEEQARKAGATMGVTFVSGEPFKTAELEGYRARYTFDDIAKVQLSMGDGAPGTATTGMKQPPFSFSFAHGAAASVLTIQLPETVALGNAVEGLPRAGASDAEKAQAAQALGMMKMMMRGMFVAITLDIDGRIVKTNAPHVERSRVTLLQIDFDQMLAADGALEKLQSASDLKALSSVTGLKVLNDPKVTIEFVR